MNHPSEVDLALYSGREMEWWRLWAMRAHLQVCSDCRHHLEQFQVARLSARSSSELPEGLDWDRLAAEMTANIRLGLAAGACVAQPQRFTAAQPQEWESWRRPALVLAGAVLTVVFAWFGYSKPPAQLRGPEKVQRAAVTAEATADGIELLDNGRILGLSRSSDDPMVSVNLQGSVRARYIDSETGQVTIHNVYVQ